MTLLSPRSKNQTVSQILVLTRKTRLIALNNQCVRPLVSKLAHSKKKWRRMVRNERAICHSRITRVVRAAKAVKVTSQNKMLKKTRSKLKSLSNHPLMTLKATRKVTYQTKKSMSWWQQHKTSMRLMKQRESNAAILSWFRQEKYREKSSRLPNVKAPKLCLKVKIIENLVLTVFVIIVNHLIQPLNV